jgi:ribonucleoside-diphosphate reductase alpha chain
LVEFKLNIGKLNEDIKLFPNVVPVTEEMNKELVGVSRLVMIDRYSYKDIEKKTLSVGDFVVLTVKEDPKYPARGLGYIVSINKKTNTAVVKLDDEFLGSLETPAEIETGEVSRSLDIIEKPLELFYEQIARRNAIGLASVELTDAERKQAEDEFYSILSGHRFVPAGRVLYGAGAGTEVTYFNCYVLPFPKDSRGGISDHRKTVMEIMSRGGGVGTNGSTLRPKNALARGVNGKSSGAVSWLDDIAKLTHLVEQGGSRRGAQMIMLADWHPDIVEFILSKMQNPRVLRYLLEQIDNDFIKEEIKKKLKFTALSDSDRETNEKIVKYKELFNGKSVREAEEKLRDGGTFGVLNPDFLTGANISVTLTSDFMEAVDNDDLYALRFPDVENYNVQDKNDYDEKWHEIGDVREWESLGYGIKTYREIKAKDLWNLINISATYSAEPGIFFIDNANEKTNAKAYGQQVVATNPCGEQPLAPNSVCNLAAVNLASMVNKETKEVDFVLLAETVRIGVRMQDNVIDASPYFLEENKKQALGERRVGLGVMGLADMLIYCEKDYGSEDGNVLVDKVFECISTSAYEASIELAKTRGSFPFLEGNSEEETIKLREAFINTGFMKDMPEYIREAVIEFGIRNSHLLTVAPTGSTGTMVNVATGLEPYFSFKYYRSGRLGKFIEVVAPIVQEYLDKNPDTDPDNLPSFFVSAMELAPECHADTQCVIQRWVDSSISKTVNAPKGYTVDQVQGVYERLYKGGAKGGTVYVDGSRDSQVLTLKAEENTFDDSELKVEETKTFVSSRDIASIVEVEDVVIGTDIGNTCPICRKGKVIDSGGCRTCTNCAAQLVCGL